MYLKPLFKPLVIAVVLLFTLTACTHYIATYDQHAYAQTTSLKVDVLNLIDKSTEAYSLHQPVIAKVTSDIMKAIEYEKHRPKNSITVRMWSKMMDSTGQNGIIGRYLESWKSDNTKSRALINEIKPQVSQGFDLIADLESQKINESSSSVFDFLK